MTGERYFFVDKFYETDFKKIIPRAPIGTHVFDLSQILETEQLMIYSKVPVVTAIALSPIDGEEFYAVIT